MSTIKKSLIAFTALGLVACASQPENMEEHYVSHHNYKNMSCEELEREAGVINAQASQLFHKLNEEANLDAAQFWAGMLVVWPSLFFLEGGDGADADTYSRLKGEFTAVERAARAKGCPGVGPRQFSLLDELEVPRG